MLQSSSETPAEPRGPTPEEHKSVSDVTDDGGEGLANLKAALNDQLLDLENLCMFKDKDTETNVNT
jgi:hypothetical protein